MSGVAAIRKMRRATGLKNAAEQYRSFASYARQIGEASSAPDRTIRPVMKLAGAYIGVAAISDLVDTARTRLAAADELARDYPVDMVDALLRSLRERLEADDAEQRFGPGAAKIERADDIRLPRAGNWAGSKSARPSCRPS
jgi:hypothetical protein